MTKGLKCAIHNKEIAQNTPTCNDTNRIEFGRKCFYIKKTPLSLSCNKNTKPVKNMAVKMID